MVHQLVLEQQQNGKNALTGDSHKHIGVHNQRKKRKKANSLLQIHLYLLMFAYTTDSDSLQVDFKNYFFLKEVHI